MSDKYKVLTSISTIIKGILAGFGYDAGLDRDGKQVRTPCDVAEIIAEDGSRFRVWIRNEALANAFNGLVESGEDEVKLLRTTREVEVKVGRKVEVKKQVYHDFLKTTATVPEKVEVASSDSLER